MTEEKYVLLKHDKSVEYISKKKAEAIAQAMAQGARGIKRDDGIGFLPFSSIADFCSLTEFYTKYPDKRPELERTPEQIAKEREYYKPIEFTASKRQQAFKALLTGLKKFVEREKKAGNPYQNALALYKEKLQKYIQLFAKKDERSELEKIAEEFGGEVIN